MAQPDQQAQLIVIALSADYSTVLIALYVAAAEAQGASRKPTSTRNGADAFAMTSGRRSVSSAVFAALLPGRKRETS